MFEHYCLLKSSTTTTNIEMIKVFLIILFADVCQCAVTVTPQEEFVTQGTSLTIIATTDEAAVTWTYKSGLSLSLCSISSSFCLNSNVENMVLSADASTNTTTITISAVNCSINTALYTATTSFDVATADIVVTTPASSIDITTSLSTQKVSTQVLSFNIPCVDPQPVANFTITRQGKPDETIDGVTVGSSNSGCQCTESTYTILNIITASNYPNEVVSVAANVGQLSPILIGTVNFTGEVSKESKAIEERSEKVLTRTAQFDSVKTVGHGSGSGKIQQLGKLTFTNPVAKRWHFSNQYTLFGTVVYGIQIVLVSAVSDIVTIAIVVGVLVYYYGQIKCITILYLFLLTAAFSIVGVLIYMLILGFFGDKDFIHIKFKKKKESIKLSAHGMKPKKDNNICIYFKVKAIYASITLYIIENMEEHHDGSKPKIRQLKKVLPLCFIDNMNDSNDSNHGNAIQYQAFYLKCENKTKTITLFDGNYKQIEQWTISADSFKIGDIEISNIKQDDSTKDDSANYDSTKDDSKKDNSSKDNSTGIEQAELYTSEEWIFWFREGDTLSENSQFHQTVLLFCVVILPIAWLVMIVLVLRNLLKSKEKNTDNTESELKVNLNQNQQETSEQQIKKQNG